jgi:hypothetical protein
MEYDAVLNKKISRLSLAFLKDGYEMIKGFTLPDGIGIKAQHKTAKNYDTGQRKSVFYLEGTPYQMGYLLGLLAEPEVADMAIRFKENVVYDYIGIDFIRKSRWLKDSLMSYLYHLSNEAYKALPQEIRDEVQGIYDGCKHSNPYTQVNMEHLIVLNIGIDVLCSLIYTGNFLQEKEPHLQPNHIKLSMMCNAFSVFGHEAGNGHFFGRDFMFATGGVFQNHAAHIIYNTVNKQQACHPFVSVSAPGIVGSIAAMNIHGVAAGVDMYPSANCNPKNIGINSLLLTRQSIEHGADAQEAVDIMVHAQRGVSWFYAIADGKNDRSCVVEASASVKELDFLQYPPILIKSFLPDSDFLAAHSNIPYQNGLMVRWNDYQYPKEYLQFNKGLWKYYQSVFHSPIALYPDAFEPLGYINRQFNQKNCPSSYYFAPLRVQQSNILVLSNHSIIPQMRLCSMHPWTAMIASSKVNDIQWRYDELNYQIQQALKDKGSIDYETAKGLINFLSPDGKFPSYYTHNPKSDDGRQLRINGCTSLFDLKKKSVESHYGYYCDEWVKVTLSNYFD